MTVDDLIALLRASLARAANQTPKLVRDSTNTSLIDGDHEMTKTTAPAKLGTKHDKVTVTFPGVEGHIGQDMEIPNAIKMLKERMEYLGQTTSMTETFNCFPWDGAYALQAVLTRIYGWAQQTGTPGWFGDEPPELRKVEIAPGEFADVPWGRVKLPDAKGGGFIETNMTNDRGLFKFVLSAQVLRLDADKVSRVFNEVREELKHNSIYRGRALKLRFTDDRGKTLSIPAVSFIDTNKIDPQQLILSDDVMEQVEVNLFTPLRRVQDLLDNDVPVKRGVLMGGFFGCGKTLAAMCAARYATDNKITFAYVARADELPQGIEFAKQYQSPASVVFCEDIDRAVSGEERTVKIDDMLNIVDGLDTKNSNIMVVFTTNNFDGITPAMLRPGRLDAVIHVTPPDAKAVEKLVRFYGGKSIDKSTVLTEVGQVLAGHIPAVVAEVVKRAKLAQIMYQMPGEKVKNISSGALLASAKSMTGQLDLLERRSRTPQPAPTVDLLVEQAVERVLGGVVRETALSVDAIKERVRAG